MYPQVLAQGWKQRQIPSRVPSALQGSWGGIWCLQRCLWVGPPCPVQELGGTGWDSKRQRQEVGLKPASLPPPLPSRAPILG